MTAVAVTRLREFSVNEEDFLTKAAEGYLLSPNGKYRTQCLSKVQALLRQSRQESVDAFRAQVPRDHYSRTRNIQRPVRNQ